MRRRSSAARACLLAAVVLIPASAVAAPIAQLDGALPPPRAGTWRIISGGPSDDNVHGSFTIGANGTVSRLAGRIRRDAETACGTGVVTVSGSQKIFLASGRTPAGSPYNEWVVGRSEPGADPVIQPASVKLIVNGKHVDGALDIVFSNIRNQSGGDIYYAGGNCDLNFLVRRR
jgi:hypothetical protein